MSKLSLLPPVTMPAPILVRQPCLHFPLDVWQQLRHYVDTCPTEVSGLGRVIIDQGQFLITELFLLPQCCTGAYTEIDQQALGEFFNRWICDGRDPAELRFWWHSHASSKTFWSGRDEEHIAEYQRNAWWLSLVTNHAGAVRARLDIFQPVTVTLDQLPVLVDTDVEPTQRDRWDMELDACVQPFPATTPEVNTNGLLAAGAPAASE